jgi:hypothetical protein
MEDTQKTEDVTEYIKLTRNSRGYTWDIKVNSIAVERIKQINEEMLKAYPGDKE